MVSFFDDSYILEFRNVSHRFPKQERLWSNVSFSMRRGETLAITGRSGCGKSTLLSIAAGWLVPTSGMVVREKRAKICWVFQNPYGPSRRTALDIATYSFVVRGICRESSKRKALTLLEQFDLLNCINKQFRELSGGEAQRLMLVRAIAAEPDIMLVDEPTAQLDTVTALEVNQVLGNLAERGTAVLVATHDRSARDSCRRVLDLGQYSQETSK